MEMTSNAWIVDPRRTAPDALQALVDAQTQLAAAEHALATAKMEQGAWMGTTVVALSSKYSKWPKWRIDAAVQAEPKWRYHAVKVADLEQDVAVLQGVVYACRSRVGLLGTFYNIEMEV